MLEPPVGSKIKITYENGDPKITIPCSTSIMRRVLNTIFIILAIFTLAFLCKLLGSEFLKNTNHLNLLLYLAIQPIIILYLIFLLFRNFKTILPETITLSQQSLQYDSGITQLPPLFLPSFTTRRAPLPIFFRILFQKRIRTEINYLKLKTLALTKLSIVYIVLTVYDQEKKYYLGISANNAEREWLFKTIQDYYNLPQQIHHGIREFKNSSS